MVASTSAKVWVKIPTIALGSNSIRMVYGSGVSISGSDIDRVMSYGGLNMEVYSFSPSGAQGIYDNRNLEGICPVFESIDYDWEMDMINTCVYSAQDHISLSWKGWLVKPDDATDSVFSMISSSDDGLFLRLDGDSVYPFIDTWKYRGFSGVFDIEDYIFLKDAVSLSFEMFESSGDARATFAWNYPGNASGSPTIVPVSAFRFLPYVEAALQPNNIVYGLPQASSDSARSYLCHGYDTLTVTDANGCSNDFYVEILPDTVSPVSTMCPANVAGICSTSYDPIDPEFSDNCTIREVTWAMTGATTASGAGYVGWFDFNEGTTTLTYTAQDPSGNSVTCAFDITIMPPHLSATAIQPLTCGADGLIGFTLENVPDGDYTIAYDGGSFTNVPVAGGSANVSVGPGAYNNLTISVGFCTSADVVSANVNTYLCPELTTDSVTTIGETTATLYGSAMIGDSIVEFGFYYSTDTTSSTLVNGHPNTTEVMVYNGSPISLSDSSYSSDITSLNIRAAYYFRAYMKNASGAYSYGEKGRFISEKRDFSLALDGDGDCLVIDEKYTGEAINNWGDADNTFSLDFWIKKGSAVTTKQMLCSNISATAGYLLALNNGNVVFENHSGSSVSSSLQITDQEWHHVAVTYNDGSALIFIDDSISSTLAIPIVKPTTDVNCFIGAAYNGSELENAFHGYLDAMRFWNVALSQEQVSELLYDIIREGVVPNTVEGLASGHVIPGLAWENLTASLGFNVKSTEEDDTSFPVSFLYEDQTQLHQFPFFHNDARLAEDKVAFNIVSIGDAHPSPYLPRVYWRYNSTESVWLNSNNWGGCAFPGEGAISDSFPDVTAVDLLNDSAYCLYTVVDSSANSPLVTVTPPEVQVLIDRDDSIGTYRVDESASELTILTGIYPEIFDVVIENDEGSILIE
ncbi:MAG: HYR domain-containing protein, partial [Bacteroidales bacterium]|nr:HYR domain-containing protein [Bacteroidales bacterium]